MEMTSTGAVCCGIDIAARRAIFVFLRREGQGVVDLTGNRSQIKIEDAEHPAEVRRFCRTAHDLLDNFQPARIAIVQRKKSGHFAAGGTTFKLEGLLQLYRPTDITIVASAVLRQFSKERQPVLCPRFGYQKNAYLLARYLLAQFEEGGVGS